MIRPILMVAALSATVVGAPLVGHEARAQAPETVQAVAERFGGEDALDAMALAHVEVRAAEVRYRTALAEAVTADEAVTLRRAMQAEVRAILEDRGLTAEEFDDMVRASREDEALRSELSRRIGEVERARRSADG
ncbi:MAG: DUF4168 domain-containing protein [Gemmatimonadales bacterium]|nr:MAG: DUF4168 domain-containing protein [Gemmatimonadales bacterium]